MGDLIEYFANLIKFSPMNMNELAKQTFSLKNQKSSFVDEKLNDGKTTKHRLLFPIQFEIILFWKQYFNAIESKFLSPALLFYLEFSTIHQFAGLALLAWRHIEPYILKFK
jgi:hypothetical protein